MVQIISILPFLFVFVLFFEKGLSKVSGSNSSICHCVYLNDKTSVYCNIVGEFGILPRNFEPIGIVELGNSSDHCLPGNLFSNTEKITEIRLLCPFKCLHEISLRGMPYLELIEMRNTKFIRIPTAIATATSVMNLKLEKGKLSVIGAELRHLVNLTILSFDHNRIRTISKVAFIHNVNLQLINLNYNRISSFRPEIFRFCQNFRVFLVEHNLLRKNVRLPQSKSLEVSRNYLYYKIYNVCMCIFFDAIEIIILFFSKRLSH